MTYMELTKEYLDQKFSEERAISDEKFDELARTIAKGFEGTATRESVEKLQSRMDRFEAALSQLTEQVKEFVSETRKHGNELSTLAVRCSKLEERIEQLEHRLQFGAA